MNHTTIASLVAISLVASMALAAISILSSTKVMAQAVATPGNGNGNGLDKILNGRSLNFGGFKIGTDSNGINIDGPNDFNVKQPLPRIPLPDISDLIDNCPGNSGNPGQGCENGNAGSQ